MQKAVSSLLRGTGDQCSAWLSNTPGPIAEHKTLGILAVQTDVVSYQQWSGRHFSRCRSTETLKLSFVHVRSPLKHSLHVNNSRFSLVQLQFVEGSHLSTVMKRLGPEAESGTLLRYGMPRSDYRSRSTVWLDSTGQQHFHRSHVDLKALHSTPHTHTHDTSQTRGWGQGKDGPLPSVEGKCAAACGSPFRSRQNSESGSRSSLASRSTCSSAASGESP